MSYESGVLMTLGDEKYIIIDTIMYENVKYLFTNEVRKNEELTEDYYIFRVNGEKVKIIRDDELINKLLPLFQEKLRETIMKNF